MAKKSDFPETRSTPSQPTHNLKVGGQVHCSKDLGSVCDLKNEPLCAIVTAVHCDGTVNLCVFDRDGRAHPQQFVPVVTEHRQDEKQKTDFCCPCVDDPSSVLWDSE